MNTKDITYIGICAALIAICSWISIPTTVPFTLQTFAVFLTCYLLGGKKGALAVLTYILLGCIGIPVFANFSGGLGVVLGTTGGYIVGFIFSALIIWLFEKLFGNSLIPTIIAMLIGLLVCYAFGTLWFMFVYTSANGAIDLMTVLGWCIFPFIIPDVIKIALAITVGNRLKKGLKLN